MFEPKKFNDIFESMRLKTLESGVLSDYEVGSVTRTLQESFAWEMAAMYEKINLVYLSAFVDTAEGGHLDKVVAILGLKRGEPEFAIGEVLFERDKGDDPITIPVGTLVGTPETPETPQKLYQTTESAVLNQGDTIVTVFVQALIAGEGLDAPAGTVSVMPRPIPGVKGVSNTNEILLVGKKRETDEDLRRRAKNTLLASGKATTIAIENNLLALPGVTDVQVREDFKYAQGRVRLTRKAGVAGDIEIPAQATITLTAGPNVRSFEVMHTVAILTGQNEVIVEVRALLEGKAGEVRSMTPGSILSMADAGLNAKVSLQLVAFIVPGNFGVIRVFVDGPELVNPGEGDPTKLQRYQVAIEEVRTELDRVRAAGVYAILESARPVYADLALLVALDPSLKPTPEERNDLEHRTREAVLDHFRQIRMEQPLVYAKLLRAITDVDGVDDLIASRVVTETVRPSLPSVISPIVENAFNRIEVLGYERLLPRDVCVASEPKTLSVDFEFNLPPPGTPVQEESTFNLLQGLLSSRFDQKAAGAEINLTEILAGQVSPAKVILNAWCERESLPKSATPTTKFKTLFFERAALGSLFVYYRYLDITGAVRLTLSPTLDAAGRTATKTAVKKAIDDYLDGMKPEVPVLFETLEALAGQVPNVESVEWDAEDFRVTMSDGSAPENRLDPGKKRIQPKKFEKNRLLPGHFLIADGRSNLRMDITGLNLNLFRRRDANNNPITLTASEIDAVKNAVAVAVNSFFNTAEMGADISFEDFKTNLEGQASGIGYAPAAFNLLATAADGRTQTITLGTPTRNIHVRSMELPVLTPITIANISHTPV